jgi:hypothetical protein
LEKSLAQRMQRGRNPWSAASLTIGLVSETAPEDPTVGLALVLRSFSEGGSEATFHEVSTPVSARGSVRFSPGEPRLVHESLDKHGKGSDDGHCKVHQCTRNHAGPVFRGGFQSLANDLFDWYE